MSPAERTSEEWGRAAVGLTGWRWTPGMLTHHRERVLTRVHGGRLLVQPDDVEHECGRVLATDGPMIVRADDGGPRRPDPDDPAAAGCLEALLGDEAWRVRFIGATAGAWCWEVVDTPDAEPGSGRLFGPGEKGRACIAAAEALGRWPGGER